MTRCTQGGTAGGRRTSSSCSPPGPQQAEETEKPPVRLRGEAEPSIPLPREMVP